MAERWQQWMPFHIDRFRGSPDVQAMHPVARIGYLYLLASAWQTDDCTVSADPIDLAALSGLGDDLWAQHSLRILRKFEACGERLRNCCEFAEWQIAKRKYADGQEVRNELSMARSQAGKAGAAKRWQNSGKPHGKRMANAIEGDGKPMANDSLTGTVTTTETKTKNKQKTSRGKREPDPRHEGFKAAVMSYGAFKRVKLPWGPGEGNQLALLLKSAPDLTLLEFQKCLTHRARSEGVPHGDRPMMWLPNILRYQQGPLNAFNRTEDSHGKQGKSAGIAQTAEDALGILRAGRMASTADFDGGADHAGPGAGRHREGQNDRIVEGHVERDWARTV